MSYCYYILVYFDKYGIQAVSWSSEAFAIGLLISPNILGDEEGREEPVHVRQ